MLLSINWLKDFIQFDLSPELLAEKLVMAGIEVEQISHSGAEWDHIVVGEIIDIKPHPQADKLSLTRVQAGAKTFPVVCGASNIRIGQKVPLALEGAVLPSGIKIKEAKIRGELSQGMLCSAQELTLGEDSSGIMILSHELQSGVTFANAIGLADTILELSITPNRPDCLSVIGMAREISAILDIPFSTPEISVQENGTPLGTLTSVEIVDADLCPRYTARVITDVEIGPSPLWMRRRLESCGIRSINNAVDVTNYVLLEWGQPLHAFDYDLLSDHRIIVKRALDGEHFTTLDGSERCINSDFLMICDGERPVALGGIMGGQNSEIHASTRRILLESAYFSPGSIRKTSRSLNLKTEASIRFERGIDVQGVVPSLNRAASLIAQLCKGTVAGGIIDCYPQPLPPASSIKLSYAKTCRHIGISCTSEDIEKLLKRLHMSVNRSTEDEVQVTPPSFRVDIQEPVDLIEEVARLNGYQHIPLTYPLARISGGPPSVSHFISTKARDTMVALGFHEAINYSFIDPALLSLLNLPPHDHRFQYVSILNPLAGGQSVLRTSLTPSLLVNLEDNLRHKNNSVKLFEISTVFFADAAQQLPIEKKRLSGLICGLRFQENWSLPRSEVDFFDIKGCVEALLDAFSITTIRFFHDIREPFMHPHNCLSLLDGDYYAGFFGEVHPEVMIKFNIEQPVYLFDIDFDFITSSSSGKSLHAAPLPRNPAINRDMAFVVDESVTAEAVHNAIASFKNKLIEHIQLFDCFSGGTIPPGKKSLAYRIQYQSYSRNLTDEEINKIQEKLLAHVIKEVGAALR